MNNLKTIQESANLLLSMIPTLPETASYQSCCLDPKYLYFPQELAQLNARITDYLAQAPEIGDLIETELNSWLEDFLPDHGTRPLAEWTESLTHIRNFADMMLQRVSSPWPPATPQNLVASKPTEEKTPEIDITQFLVDDSPPIPNSDAPGPATQPPPNGKRKKLAPPTPSIDLFELKRLIDSKDLNAVLTYAAQYRPLPPAACQRILDYLIPHGDTTHLSTFIKNHTCILDTQLLALVKSMKHPKAWRVLSTAFLPGLGQTKYRLLCRTALDAKKAPVIADLLAEAIRQNDRGLPRRQMFDFLKREAPAFLTKEMIATLDTPKIIDN